MCDVELPGIYTLRSACVARGIALFGDTRDQNEARALGRAPPMQLGVTIRRQWRNRPRQYCYLSRGAARNVIRLRKANAG